MRQVKFFWRAEYLIISYDLIALFIFIYRNLWLEKWVTKLDTQIKIACWLLVVYSNVSWKS